MSGNGIEVPAHRATVLVGYGAFGLATLRLLLASTVPRGVLQWEEPRGGADPGERSLRDLALLWVPDRVGSEGQQVDEESAREGSAIEMMRDLYRQIQPVGADPTPEAGFAAALSEAAEKLLSASLRAARPAGVLPLGLDVIVLAHPADPETIGALDRLLGRGMERLANNANLERAVPGSEALNFLALFDFENYWDRFEPGRSVRQAVRDSIELWRRRRAQGQPAYGRLYLVDGRTDDGIRDVRHRMDEICLFLEFLLFEGQRGGELQRLYQSPGGRESPVATFGIRLTERSAGLLSHLAAARFGIGWLDYMVGSGPMRSAAEPLELRQRLAPYGPEALDILLGGDSLRGLVDGKLAVLEHELTALPAEAPDWPERVRARYEEMALHLEERLAELAHARMLQISKDHLVRLPDELRDGIDADLHHARDPVPLGAVVGELERMLERLERVGQDAPSRRGEAEVQLQDLARLHAAYRGFLGGRVRIEGLRQWWPLLAIALAGGATPIVVDLLSELPPPDPMSFLQTQLHGVLRWLANPLAVGLLLFLLAWGLGARALQGRIAARMERARRFYTDAERGRLIDRLRGGLAAGGALRAPIDRFLDRLLLDMALSVRGEVSRELGVAAARLRERRREMLWLREQLRAFLDLHRLSADEQRPGLDWLIRDGTGIRHTVERGQDLEDMLRGNPPTAERFRSTQASQLPFARWAERYSPAFLYPLDFIARLSQIYKDPFLQELSQPGAGPEQQRRAREFLDFLKQYGSFALAFRWKRQEGVPPHRRYCLLPAVWRTLPQVLPALSGLGVGEESVLPGVDVARAYLLRLQTGVEPESLVET